MPSSPWRWPLAPAKTRLRAPRAIPASTAAPRSIRCPRRPAPSNGLYDSDGEQKLGGDPGKPIGALHQPEPPSQRIPRDARLERRHPPSEPNYLWLEGGTDYGIVDDNDPAQHHLANKDHLVSLLTQAGISWKAYQQGIDGTRCPLQSQELYAAKHDPFVFFDAVTDGNNPRSATCTAHVRPLEELSADLQSGSVARYNFIAPDLCNDMHGSAGCPVADGIAAGDAWLADWIPRIMQSQAYMDGGAILITWDEADANDQPIGLIVLSPLAKRSGYSNAIAYSHSSTLRSLQEIFNVGPLLCDAAKAESLSDLFVAFP